MEKTLSSEEMTKQFGRLIGDFVSGGDFIELIGDIGAGKTTFVKGLAEGLEIVETVQSPTFTINRTYDGRDGLRLAHYDFYRLGDAGIMADELAETVSDSSVITVVEWGSIVRDVTPADRLTIKLNPVSDSERLAILTATGERSRSLLERIT